MKKKINPLWIIGLAILVIFIFQPGSGDTQSAIDFIESKEGRSMLIDAEIPISSSSLMSFASNFQYPYTPGDCYVDDNRFAACVIATNQANTKSFGDSGWSYLENCNAWMTYFGCDPSECIMENGGVCSGSVEEVDMDLCEYDSDCDSGEVCYRAKCIEEEEEEIECVSGYQCQDGYLYRCDDNNWKYYDQCTIIVGKTNACVSDGSTGSSYRSLCKNEEREEYITPGEKEVIKVTGGDIETTTAEELLCKLNYDCKPTERCEDGICIPFSLMDGVTPSIHKITEEGLVCCKWLFKKPVLVSPGSCKGILSKIINLSECEHLKKDKELPFGGNGSCSWVHDPNHAYPEGTILNTEEGNFVCRVGVWETLLRCHQGDFAYDTGYIIQKEYPEGSGDLYEFECVDGGWVKGKKIDDPPWVCELYSENNNGAINLLFINNLASKSEFLPIIKEIHTALFEYSPFSKYKSSFNFYIINSGLPHRMDGFRLIGEEIIRASNNCNLPDLYVTVIDDYSPRTDSYMMHSGQNTGHIHQFTKEMGALDRRLLSRAQGITESEVRELPIGLIWVHEFGHLFGRLDDEYVYKSSKRQLLGGGNCDATVIPIKGLAPFCHLWGEDEGDCIRGCAISSAYRSSQDSIMRGGSSSDMTIGFNPVSMKIIENKIHKLRSPVLTESFMASITPEKEGKQMIVTVHLSNEILSIKQIELQDGYPDSKIEGELYKISILSDENELLYSTTFTISTTIFSFPDPLIFDSDGNQIDYPVVEELPESTLAVSLPYYSDAWIIEISQEGELISSANIPFKIKGDTGYSNYLYLLIILLIIIGYYFIFEKGPKKGFFKTRRYK